MSKTARYLPTLVNTRDLKNISKLMEKLRQTGEEAYLVTNSEIQAIITPVPEFVDSEQAIKEREEAVVKSRKEIESFWSNNPQLNRPKVPVTKQEMRKYAH